MSEYSTIASDKLSTKRDILRHVCYGFCGMECNAWNVNMAAEIRVKVQEWMDSYRHFTIHFTEVE